MTDRYRGRALFCTGLSVAWLLTAGLADLSAQRGRGAGAGGGQPPAVPRAAAPADLTGYWVAVITEDWRFRMLTAPKGDTNSVPLNQAGIAASAAWDPAKDIAAGDQCKAYGAPGIMRLPVRLNIAWRDDQTLKMDIDNGTQTRLFHFDRATPVPEQPDWQGRSLASWETVAEGLGQPAGAAGRGGGGGPPALSGSLKVVTTEMRPGYLRRNGVPYGPNATYTEYFDRMPPEPNGDTWLILTSVVEDSQYLALPFVLTTHYKREADGTKFRPRPCEVTPPVTPASVGAGR